MVLAHRIAWEMTHGTIPMGLYVLHRCDTPACVNPEHLFLGDQTVNMQDAKRKGRTRCGNTGKTHCVHGHPFTPDNTYHYPGSQYRLCMTCKRIRERIPRAS